MSGPIVEFVLARFAEVEADAKAALDPDRPGTHWQWVRSVDDVAVAEPTWEDGAVSLRSVEEFPTRDVGDLPAFALNYVETDVTRALPHIARHDPARVLAECEAKRTILHLTLHGCGDDYERIQRALALPFADHPDYREAFRP